MPALEIEGVRLHAPSVLLLVEARPAIPRTSEAEGVALADGISALALDVDRDAAHETLDQSIRHLASHARPPSSPEAATPEARRPHPAPIQSR